jgi:hypothetical protein
VELGELGGGGGNVLVDLGHSGTFWDFFWVRFVLAREVRQDGTWVCFALFDVGVGRGGRRAGERGGWGE